MDFGRGEVNASKHRAAAVSALSFRILEQIAIPPELCVFLRQNESVGVVDDELEALHGLWFDGLRQEHEEVAGPSSTGYAPTELMQGAGPVPFDFA